MPGFVLAQMPTTKRQESIPSFSFTSMKSVMADIRISTDGNRILAHDGQFETMGVLLLKEKSGRYLQPNATQRDAVGMVHQYFYSPNLQYRVVNTFGFKSYVPAKKGNGKIETIHDWQTHGASLLEDENKDYHFEAPENYFTLAVTDEGKLITTKPGGFKKQSKYGPGQPTKCEGLFLVDPMTKASTTLSAEDKFPMKTQFVLSPDGQLFCWIEDVHFEKGKGLGYDVVHAFDLATAKSWTFQKPRGISRYQLSNTLLYSKDYISDPGKDAITLYNVRSGKLVAKEPIEQSYTEQSFLVNDKLFFYNEDTFSLLEVKANDKQGLNVLPPVMLDTTGLQIDTARYFTQVMASNRLMLLPNFYEEKRRTRAYAFDITTGKPTLIIYNLYDNIYPPSHEKVMAEEESACRRATAKLPFPVGATLSDIKGDCSKPAAFITAYDCKRDKYTYGVFNANTVYTTSGAPYEIANKYKYCSTSNLKMCTRCNGMGSYNETIGVKLDQWEQVNFNVYVRDPNKVTRTNVNTTCPVCKGKGVL
ncbi:MAG: hypothetical protein HOP08_12480 [Cyclobacteriaceae bacterium]|nr:hypothetical protein [Cyclobacteriaceae bacterium]